VASNILPAAMRRLCDLARDGKADAAHEIDAQLQPAFEFLGVEPNPIPVKAVLALRGIGHGLRLPLLPLSAAYADAASATATRVRELESAYSDVA
jgi:4-hydroxy-tetrahydrodipicolinate synthase